MRSSNFAMVIGMLMCTRVMSASLDILVTSPSAVALEDVAVLLESPAAKATRSQQSAAIAQKDREFTPYVTIVQSGAMVDFPNRDPLKHHVYSFSPAKTFEIKLYAGKPEKAVKFDKPGEVALGCNIHDWMEAYLLVVETPYFAKTGADGRARISNIPPGHYTLRLWHPRSTHTLESRELDVRTTHLSLTATAIVTPKVIKPKPALESGGY